MISRPSKIPVLIYRFVKTVFPLVETELDYWRSRAGLCPDSLLAKAAIASIRDKKFHCQGGSIYALYPGADIKQTVEFIVAYQTISDYLDNLVDSLEITDQQAFAQLHLAMRDALDPEYGTSDYYLYFPYQNDGGYLAKLVTTCQENISYLSGYELIKTGILRFAGLYADLQTYKHLALEQREDLMLAWIKPELKAFSRISEWEFAAATGSTLGIFCLYAIASNPKLSREEVKAHQEVYFPWINGLHILLDYLIDLAEDRETGQLNFIRYYGSLDKAGDCLARIWNFAWEAAGQLAFSNFHKAILQGLLALYLSDPKCLDPEIQPLSKLLISRGGTGARLLQWICRDLRKSGVI
ncbi:MAG: tetraprenyl-beta-curcumene synthase family protein [Desulfitobacteriaceae bacterium]|nr:tetraprenyl-beta-curcumene synthase family protein [Desulfitobacteriaceae bacterium]MDD4346553.1 tetraprenyl-beta-curcumene synthase family protein [Desulfitobacteriaceae bacterium]